MNKLKSSLLGLAVAGALLPQAVSAAPFTTDLVQGRKLKDVGDIQVWNDANFLYVKYITAAGYCLNETHLAVATSLSGIPQKNGNPPPGQFKYKGENLDCATEWTKKIPLDPDWTPGTKLYIAAHGVACGTDGKGSGTPNIPNLCASLPESVMAGIYNPGANAYFDVVIPDSGPLMGNFPGWCLSTDIGIQSSGVYTTAVYCTTVDVLPGFVPLGPGDISKLNYLLNQNYVGQSTPDGLITYGDVQMAIWLLLGQVVPPDVQGLGPTNQNRIDLILLDVAQNGMNFVPGCDQLLGIILIPYNDAGAPQQPVLIPIPVPCKPVEKECGTVWGKGYDFPGKNWAMYFKYCVQGPD